ncbi:MAG: ankyrin repeat domain-containing protein, partial [Acidobacteriota bacterium]|nr:ankyrin repeat domain-containing protein [Acidobacteriota bacterium]
MYRARSHSGLEEETPQYAHALAILGGGAALILPQMQSQIPAWLAYVLLASLFGSIWPDKFWQWAVWLCLPPLLLALFNLVSTFNLTATLAGYGMVFVKSSFYAYVGAYLGSKLSLRKLAARPAHGRELKRGGKRRSGIPVSKEFATPIKAIGHVSHIQDLNAALNSAVQEGDLCRIGRLIADGADVNAWSKDRWAPPVIAAQGFDVEAVKTLFGQEATDVSVGLGWTALMIATIAGHREVVTALVEHGAEVNALNDQGWT